jgi:hypothetical protein
MDRNELGAMFVQAQVGSARNHALISLLAPSGLGNSKALGTDILMTRTTNGSAMYRP